MKYNALKLFGKDILEQANGFSRLCTEGKRWHGSTLLITLDACLDSTGLNYFSVVVPKVIEFDRKYVKTGLIKRCSDFHLIENKKLLEMFKNERVWNAMSQICNFLSSEKNNQEFKRLREWAVKADPHNLKKDSIGRIKGVGISTFQYLRIQCGIDTIMPDKVIAKWISSNFVVVKTPYECIEKGMKISHLLGITGIELCWAIWIKESGELDKIAIE
jgi:hypothetical protein